MDDVILKQKKTKSFKELEHVNFNFKGENN